MINTAVILAAGMGIRLRDLVKNVPKGFIQINGHTLIDLSIQKLHRNGIENIIIVTGYLSEFYDGLKIKYNKLTTIKNNEFADSGSMYSLYTAREILKSNRSDFLLLESDLLYDERALFELLRDNKDNAILTSGFTQSGDEVYVEADGERLINMSKKRDELENISGELVGISKISFPMFEEMITNAEKMFKESLKVEYEQCIVKTSKKYPVYTLRIDDLIWTEIDDPEHLKRALEKIAPKVI